MDLANSANSEDPADQEIFKYIHIPGVCSSTHPALSFQRVNFRLSRKVALGTFWWSLVG